MKNKMHNIYVAGPLYTPEERKLLEKIDRLCRKIGFDTYLPHRDAGLFIRGKGSERFFREDVKKLGRADMIVAVLNGADIDSGTCWEIGYAYREKKPIIGYLDSTRIYEPEQQLNLMIYNSLDSLVHNMKNLEKTLKGYK